MAAHRRKDEWLGPVRAQPRNRGADDQRQLVDPAAADRHRDPLSPQGNRRKEPVQPGIGLAADIRQRMALEPRLDQQWWREVFK